MFTGLMEIVATGGAHTAVADITLRAANTRAPAGNSPFLRCSRQALRRSPNPIQSNQVTMYLKDWFVSEVVTQRHQLWASTYMILQRVCKGTSNRNLWNRSIYIYTYIYITTLAQPHGVSGRTLKFGDFSHQILTFLRKLIGFKT